MRFAPIKWIKAFHYATTGLSFAVLVLYVVGSIVLKIDTKEISLLNITPVAAVISAIQLIYAMTLFRRLYGSNPWQAVLTSYLMMVVNLFVIMSGSGNQGSPYVYVLGVYAFFGALLGVVIAYVPFGIVALFYLLMFTGGTVDTSVAPDNVIALPVATFLGALLGWLTWRWFYIKSGETNAERLAALLRNEQRKSELILTSIVDGVVLLDNEGIIRYMNPSAGKITGWEIADAIGLRYDNVLKLCGADQKPYDAASDPFQQVKIRGGMIRDNAAVLQVKAGTYLPISVDATQLVDADSKPTGDTLGVFSDVSKEREEEARRADFISTASHEMRTPVAAIEGYLALAMNENVAKIDDKARSFLQKAHDSTQHLGQLFQDLLTSAKAEDGRLTSHPVVMEMSAFLEQLTDSLGFSAQKKQLGVEFVIGSQDSMVDASGDNAVVKPLYYVMADPDRMREVITNLFDNAVKYTDAGKITIGLTGDDKVVQFRITDTGAGIPAEDVPHLFQKFYRVDSSATRTIGGTGLGLFICRKIVELYQGRIWVESVQGQGSTFFINLPRLSTQQAGQLQAQSTQNTPQ